MKTAFVPSVLAVLCLGLVSVSQPANSTDLQSQESQSRISHDSGSGNQVVFRLDWDQGVPWIKYEITVAEDGSTHFDGTPNPNGGGDSDPFQRGFQMSELNRDKIFQLAKKLQYFQGNFESKQKNVAQTGRKTLEYVAQPTAEGTPVVHSRTYNWSPNPDVQELTRIFQGIASTVDYGRKLEFQYRFDKLGLDQRLKELQDLQEHRYVEELHAIEPILTKIADDPSVMHISRQIAQQLLRTLNSAGAAPPKTQP